MRNTLLFIFMLLFAIQLQAQLRTISSDVSNPLDKKLKLFVAHDTQHNFVITRENVQFDNNASAAPCLYFTTPSLTTNIVGNTVPRYFEIHCYEPTSEYDWILEDNDQENDIFFSRSRFVGQGFSARWKLHVDGNLVFFQNVSSGRYLSIDASGDLSPVENRDQASLIKLIHVF